MRCIGEWRAVSVDKEDRKALSELTDIAVVKAAGKPQVPYRPKYVLTLSVGRPPQQIEVAVDTSSGSTWLLELGAQSFHGELQDVAFYRALESRTARFIEAAELSPRVHVALGPLAARGVDVVGRIIADDVQLADLRIPSQPLIIGEKAPESVKSWHLGGSLGLGLRSDASAPLVDAWRSAWMEPPDQATLLIRQMLQFRASPFRKAVPEATTCQDRLFQSGHSSSQLQLPLLSRCRLRGLGLAYVLA
jgi:hypothetical protein